MGRDVEDGAFGNFPEPVTRASSQAIEARQSCGKDIQNKDEEFENAPWWLSFQMCRMLAMKASIVLVGSQVPAGYVGHHKHHHGVLCGLALTEMHVPQGHGFGTVGAWKCSNPNVSHGFAGSSDLRPDLPGSLALSCRARHGSQSAVGSKSRREVDLG